MTYKPSLAVEWLERDLDHLCILEQSVYMGPESMRDIYAGYWASECHDIPMFQIKTDMNFSEAHWAPWPWS